MKSLWYASLFLVLATGCVSVKPTGLVRDPHALLPAPAAGYSPPGRSLLYKASLDVRGHNLTGLLLIKRMSPALKGRGDAPPPTPPLKGRGEKYRVVFTSEVGLTFFDMEFNGRRVHWVSCFPALKKRALQKIFENNFRMLTLETSRMRGKVYRQRNTGGTVAAYRDGRVSLWHTFTPAGDTLTMISARSSAANAVEISFDSYSEGQPGRIEVFNPFIRMKMNLRKLK